LIDKFMSECVSHQERSQLRNARRAIAVLTTLALTGCAAQKESEPQAPAAPARGGNFPLHGKGYEAPTILNCQTGPREQHLEFVGNDPKAYVFELHDDTDQTIQAIRLKVFGPGSDIMATMHRQQRSLLLFRSSQVR
jgi:hypothetical protein